MWATRDGTQPKRRVQSSTGVFYDGDADDAGHVLRGQRVGQDDTAGGL